MTAAGDITDLKRALEQRAQAVAEHLLPRGRLMGREWCVGSTQGEPGESLKVCVKGAKAGVWCDFAEGGDGGDLIDLWCQVRGIDLPQALDDIRGWLGIEKPRFEKPAKSYRKPPRPQCTAPKSAVRDYLLNARKLSEDSLRAYRIGEQGRTIVFPSLVGEDLLFVKYLEVDRRPDGKKITRVEAGCEPVLFGWQAIAPNTRSIAITEGEIDALTLWDYGFPALSVPFGGGKGAKQQWIESEFERLSRFEVIFLALDNDDEGRAAVAEIVPRLGRHRCRVVVLPRKDANQCRQDGISADNIRKCFDTAQSMDPEELRRAGTFADDVVNLFWPPAGQEEGYRLPFARIGGKLLFRSGELSVWTGPSGAGKSQVLSHASVGWLDQGARICIASLEMAPRQLLKRMVKQAANVDRPAESTIRAAMAWLDVGLWLFTLVGKAKVEAVLDAFDYARARFGCDVFVIDSLMRLGIGSEDYEGQEAAVYRLVDWTVSNRVHLHLVAHARKADTKAGKTAPETEDIKGASEIGANAFNILGIWRNRDLETKLATLQDRIAQGDIAAETEFNQIKDRPPVILNVAKQRNGDWEGKVGLWFDQPSYRYRSADDNPVGRVYVPLGQTPDQDRWGME